MVAFQRSFATARGIEARDPGATHDARRFTSTSLAARRLAPFIVALATLIVVPSAQAFQVQALFQAGPSHVGVAFDDSVNVTQATQASNYTLTGSPALTIQSVVLQENHRIVYLVTASPLPQSTSYDVAVSGVTSKDGTALSSGGPTSFTTVATAPMGIAQVHANIGTLNGTSVTVIGQVYLTASSSGSTPSAYIQDGTGRGLNVFGNPLQSAVNALGNVALVTGTVSLYASTTVEIEPTSVTLIASGVPHIAPRVLSAPQVASSQWEGTYIQTTATLTAAPSASGANNYTYPASDAGTSFEYRVRNTTAIDPADFTSGDLVTGAGAGGNFFGTYQITVGNAADFKKGAGPGDTTPPTLVSAAGDGGDTQVMLTFSEPLGTGATTTSNYTVYPTASPGSPIAVTAAAANGSVVTLTLASALAAGTGYTVEVDGVEDVAGNPIAAGASVTFTATVQTSFVVTGAFQFGSKYVGVGFSDTVNATQAVQAANYVFAPALTIAAVTLQANQRTAVIELSGTLPASTAYALTVSNVTSRDGDPLVSSGPFNFTTVSQTVTDIATIHANIGTIQDQTVTVIGQVFIPEGSRGGTPSGYIQDGSGRGLNVFGGSLQPALNALGSVAVATGTVTLYFTTIELENPSASQLASGQPHLAPRVLTVAQANSSQWEGTYIQTTATITAIAASGASNYNYDATGGGADITFRVGNGVGIDPASFAVGDLVTGRGAGGAFQTTFQINVGNAADFYKSTGEPTPQGPPPQHAVLRGVGGTPFPPLTLVKNLAGEEFEFEIAGEVGARAVCRIFDLQGRLVKVLFDGTLTGTAVATLSWDARDESFELVPAGMYVCHLETTDDNGHREEDRAPIVVAARLE